MSLCESAFGVIQEFWVVPRVGFKEGLFMYIPSMQGIEVLLEAKRVGDV